MRTPQPLFGCLLADAVADLADGHTGGHHLAADASACPRVSVDSRLPVPVAVALAGPAVGDPAGVGVAVAVDERHALRSVVDDRSVEAARREVDARSGAPDAEAVVARGDGDPLHDNRARVPAPRGAGGCRGGRHGGDTSEDQQRGQGALQVEHQARLHLTSFTGDRFMTSAFGSFSI